MTLYDALRNQLARSIDVMLEKSEGLDRRLDARKPDRTCLVLLTPEIFWRNPRSRLYGCLMQEYRDCLQSLARDLPHREPNELNDVRARLGWLTWEACNAVQPKACPWLLADQ